jgi:hypothetical protein
MNKNNLSRHIDPSIKELIRAEAGFACVICGTCPYDYEHIEPEFKDAHSHDPTKMTLLCPTCHRKVSNKVFSKDLVWHAKAKPWAIEHGHTKYGLDFSGETIIFIIGDTVFENPRMPLTIKGRPILSAKYSKIESSIIISGQFYDSEGQMLGEIIENEWRGYISNVDIETKSNSVTIKRAGNIVFEYELYPPHKLRITEMNMTINENNASIMNTPNGKYFLLRGNPKEKNCVFFQFDPHLYVKGVDKIDLSDLLRIHLKHGEKIMFSKLK